MEQSSLSICKECSRPSIAVRIIVEHGTSNLTGHYRCRIGHVEVKPLEM